MKAYKLLRLRANGTLAPLFFARRSTIEPGKWLRAKALRLKGFAFRPGWHATPTPHAPHLSRKGRVWCLVELRGVKKLQKPKSQGGTWYLAKQMKLIGVIS